MAGKRRFGTVRKRASGRWEARYRGPDGRMRSADRMFDRKSDAERYLTMVEAAVHRDEWVDPRLARVRLIDYAERWIDQRPGLRPRTEQLYRWTLRKHIAPTLGGVPLANLDTALIREWRAQLLASGASVSIAAKAYRLLRAILTTAVVEDRILTRNPCRIPGADKEAPGERPVLSLAQVEVLAAAVPSRYQALILVAALGSLRYGEVIALERQDIDLTALSIRVRQQYQEIRGKGMVLGPPKSRAGRRTIAMPGEVMNLLKAHLDRYVADEPNALVFTGPKGAPIRRGNFNDLVRWRQAIATLGIPELHFHDLRHTGNVLAAASKVSTRDLMARMGHDSMAAALIYQHATRDADRAVADHLQTQLMLGRKNAGVDRTWTEPDARDANPRAEGP